MWKEGTITRRIGKVNYEVNLSGRITRKHASQLRRRDAKAPSGYGDKSLLTLLETLELDDVWRGSRPSYRCCCSRTTSPQSQGTTRRSTRI
ncbi:hypothetical protein V3C99_003784, partial [Haemonchus contortus]